MKYFISLLVSFSLSISLLLIANKNYFLGFIILGAVASVIYEKMFKIDYLERELNWVKRALFDNNELERMKNSTDFFIWIVRLIRHQEIKEGMAIGKIHEVLLKGIELLPRDKERDKSFRYYVSDLSNSSGRKDDNIPLVGYGYDFPAPELTLIIRNGILVKIRYRNVDNELRHKVRFEASDHSERLVN